MFTVLYVKVSTMSSIIREGLILAALCDCSNCSVMIHMEGRLELEGNEVVRPTIVNRCADIGLYWTVYSETMLFGLLSVFRLQWGSVLGAGNLKIQSCVSYFLSASIHTFQSALQSLPPCLL